jgi:DNA/RNA endonuclease G (NUC1)
MHPHRQLLRAVLPVVFAFCLGIPAEARIGVAYQGVLGNPDGAVTDAGSRTKFLIQRDQYHLSYNDDTHQANWVSWSITTDGLGSVGRTDAWSVENLLPAGYLRIGTSTFGTSYGIQWDRGHMAPSADRTQSRPDNEATFKMSNIIPQASSNNQGLWAQFETYCRTLASGGNEVLIISGPSQFTGNRIPNSMAVAGSVWKIAVVVPNAASTIPANERITTGTRVIALLTPNVSSGLGSWQSYITSVEEIEEVTGFNFFTEVDPSTAIYLKNLVDTGTAPNNPTVITTFNPTLGGPGTSVTVSGYNFDAQSSVQFNGVEAASVAYVSPNQLTAVVPAGATTGPLTVDGPGGFDTSYEDFTVTTGPATPTISVSPSSLSGLTAVEGSPGTAQIYAVNGTSLTSSVTVTAPANFEISADGTNFASSLVLTPAIDGSLGTQINVRITSSAPPGSVSGSISHTSAGAISRNVTVAGAVTSNSPHIIVSTASLTGFTALQGGAGAAKSYTVSGANLTGSITITAPTGYEVSLDNSTFAATRTLTPVGGTIASTTIYARLAASAPLGSNTGSITHAGGSAATQNVSVSGTVTEPGGEESWIATSGTNTKGAINTGQSFAGKSGVWINEFHYDTVSTDTGEFVEVVVGPDVTAALAEIALDLYNGSGGASYATHALSTFVLGGTTAEGYRIFYKDISGIQNGAPDGLGISIGGGSVQFLSYEGTFAATSGPANGLTSTDIGVSEGNAPVGSSLQLTGSGGSGDPVPVITVSGPATATALASFTYSIQASESPTSYAASGLPEGLSINTSTGVISGTPTTTGDYTVGLTATNAAGDGTATLTISVQANPNAPAITSDLIASGQISTAFTYQITASNSPTSYTAGNLPAGLTINTSTGLISGTPTAGGTFNATITALNDFGSDTKTLQILVRVPTLSLTPASLNPFVAAAGFYSTTQSYTLIGSELTESITVRTPQNFEISTDGATFTGEIVLTPGGDGSLFQAIIVRLTNTAPPGLTSGAISHIGSGATPRYLEVSGTVSTSEPILTVSTASLDAFTTTAGTASVIQTYEVSGASLDGLITLTAPAGFEIGADEESFGDAIELTPVNGALSPTAIYVRLRADNAPGSYTGQITHAGGGAATMTVAVSGAVEEPVGPEIIATSGGSAYVNTSYNYTIQTDGSQTVTSYGASGLPTGLLVNGFTGVISGTPTTAGTYAVTLSATGTQGTSTKTYTLRIIATSEQPTTPVVVVNKYHNAATDRVELLVIGDDVDGPPVDLRGMIIKDFNSNMASDTGGKYVFTDHPVWSNVKAGTLVVLAAGNTLAEDIDPADFVLRANLANATYFTQESGGFDIGNTDMIMIKPAGMQPDGVAGGIHALAAGTTDTQYNSYSGRKTRARRSLSGRRGYYCYVVNGNRTLADYYLNEGGDLSTSESFGSGNNADNTTFINNLRNQDQDAPVITVLGDDPVNIERGTVYTDAGATAFDAGDNAGKAVTTTGTVDTSVEGTYTLTYSATDNNGNIGTATRTVNVIAPATTPPTVSSAAAGSITAQSAALNGNVDNAGTSDVTARGFLYSTADTTLEIGAEGVTVVAAGTGTGAFSAEVSGLSAGITYYYRTYATNETGTSYGEVLSFTTLKAEPLQHAVDFAAGTINSTGIAAVWTPVEADGYLLVVSSGAQTTPTDGVTVADDTDVSDGSAAVNLSGVSGSYNSFTGFAAGESYTFRLYPFNNSGSAIDYKTGSAPSFTAGVLTTPELYTIGNPAALTTTYGTPSTATTFSVSGVYLTSTVSVTAPTGFEVSADNTTFESSVTLTPVSGTLASTTIYLRLAGAAGATGTYDGQTITVSGGGATTVTLTTAANGHEVAPQPLVVTGLSAADKDYDGGTDAEVVGSPVYQGLVNNESFALVGTVSWAFPDKNAGAGKELVRTGSFAAPSTNYIIPAQPSLTAEIRPKELVVTGAGVTTKTYDGSTDATITGATLVGVIDGDTVSVSGSGTFNNANAGENKPVTTNLILGGTDAANYTLIQPSLTGTITKADQVITFDELPAKNLGDAPFPLSGTATSGLTVSYSTSNPAVASVSGSTVTILSVGTTTITATQTGNTNYNAAAPVARTLAVSDAPTLIAGWDFQTTINGGTAAAAIPDTPISYAANLGSGTLHLDGTSGSSQWLVTSTSTTTQLNSFTGTDVNASNGLATGATSPGDLALVSDTANGQSLVFSFTMTGRANLSVSYAARRSSTGFNSQVWEFSTNGVDWQPLQTVNTIASAYAVVVLETTNALDNATNAYLRLTVSGASTSGGNNRLDNIQFVAGNYTLPDTTAPVITVLGDDPLTLPVGTAFTDPGATALDETDGTLEVTAEGVVNTTVPGSYTVTYSASDAAGNTGTATRTVNVIDVTAPLITVAGDNPLYLPVGAAFNDPGVSAFDAIDGDVAVQTTGTVDTSTRGTYVLTYTATDAAGNEATATREVIVRSGAAQFFAAQFGMTNVDLSVDSDGDGAANLMEYAFGTDPTARTDVPTATELQFTADSVRFSTIVRDGDTALTISPVVSTDLVSGWSDAGLTELSVSQSGVPQGFRRRTWESPDTGALFIRFSVSYE